MRQVLRPGALGRPREIGWRGRWEGGLGWGIHITPWLIHVNVWQNPLQCFEVISLQLIKINEKKKKKEYWSWLSFPSLGDLPDPEIEPRSPKLQVDSLPSEPCCKSIHVTSLSFWRCKWTLSTTWFNSNTWIYMAAFEPIYFHGDP